MMRLVDMTAGLTGMTMALAQVMPGVPEDFQSWPGTAMMALITITALAAGVLERRMSAKALERLATGMTKLAAELEEANRRANELAAKMGTGNELQVATLANLKARPCIAEDLVRSWKKTQRIGVDR